MRDKLQRRWPWKQKEIVATAQASVAVGSIQLTTAEQSPASFATVMSAGTPEITGASPSITVTVKLAVAEFSASSVAV